MVTQVSGYHPPSHNNDDRKISVVNVNPNNEVAGQQGGEMPEIRKYKKKFNSEILCASLWGLFIFYLVKRNSTRKFLVMGNTYFFLNQDGNYSSFFSKFKKVFIILFILHQHKQVQTFKVLILF